MPWASKEVPGHVKGPRTVVLYRSDRPRPSKAVSLLGFGMAFCFFKIFVNYRTPKKELLWKV